MAAIVGKLYPGAAVATVFGIAAYAIALRYGAPSMLIALLLGLSGHFLYEFERIRPGVDWAARAVLRFGVALLGLRIAFADVISIGAAPITIVLGAMVVTLVAGVALSRALGLSSAFGALSGGSVAVCGVSAAIAISAVLPKREHAERELAVTVAGVTTLSTIAMILYPLGNAILHLTDREIGVVLGGSIHDVAQVVGAGYSVSHEAGDTATFVKLLRVSALLPMVAAIYYWLGRGEAAEGAGKTQYLPAFLIAFFILATINSLHLAPKPVVDAGVLASQWLLLISIAAIGIKTNLKKVAEVGWRPLVLMVAQTLIMLGVVLGGVLVLRNFQT
ncbi:MAG: putative sulfate exporter family transporter [Hyphomonadaceae bacterium]